MLADVESGAMRKTIANLYGDAGAVDAADLEAAVREKVPPKFLDLNLRSLAWT
jgi:hypothetical protein